MNIVNRVILLCLAILVFVVPATFTSVALTKALLVERKQHQKDEKEIVALCTKTEQLNKLLGEMRTANSSLLAEKNQMRVALDNSQKSGIGLISELSTLKNESATQKKQLVEWKDRFLISEEKRCILEEDLDATQNNLIILQESLKAFCEMDWPSDPRGYPLGIVSCQGLNEDQREPKSLIWVFSFWTKKFYPVLDYSGKFDRGMLVLSWTNPTGRSSQEKVGWEEVNKRLSSEIPYTQVP